jgi:hypothetical protein
MLLILEGIRKLKTAWTTGVGGTLLRLECEGSVCDGRHYCMTCWTWGFLNALSQYSVC